MAKITLGSYGELNFLPVPPEAPVKEGLEWLTDVTTAYNSTEERIRIRNDPRQRFTYRLPANQWLSARAYNVAWGSTVSRWAVPVWTESQISGVLSAGLSTVPVNTAEGDFRAGSFALLWESPNLWEGVQIASLTAGSIDTVDPTVNTYTAAKVVPLRIGRVTNTINKTLNGYNTIVGIAFDIEDNTTLIAPVPPQFLGDDIYYDEGLLAGERLGEDISKRANLLDEKTGVVAFNSPWINSRTTRPFRAVLEDRAAVWAFRQWLHRRAGRYVQFWQPSFESDIRLTSTGVVASSVTALRDDYLLHTTNRVHVAFEDDAGVWYPRTIVDAVALTASSMRLDLDSPLNILADTIVRTSYLGLKRLEPDKIEFNWLGGGAASIGIRVVELTP